MPVSTHFRGIEDSHDTIRGKYLEDFAAEANTVLIVGSRHLLHDHPLVPRSLLRCCLLGPPVQAESVARLGWPGLRCRSCLGGSRWYVQIKHLRNNLSQLTDEYE